MTVKLADEIAKQLFDGYTRRWSVSRTQKIVDGTPTEPDISALIAACIDEAGIQVTSFLSAAVGHSPDRENCDYYLVEAWDPLVSAHIRKKRTDNGGYTRIHPDIFVCRESKRTGRSEIVVAVELKRDAVFNHINCPTGAHPDYSNQLVCYVHGCWLSNPADHPELTYVYLAPKEKLSDAAIEAKALSSDPDRLDRLNATGAAHKRQVDALATKWHRAPLEDLIEALRRGSPKLSDIIEEWVAGGGNRRRDLG